MQFYLEMYSLKSHIWIIYKT